MGTYLSTPVTDKNCESGEALQCPEVPLCWGVVDMQGWRKSMEDAHVAHTDVGTPVGIGGGGKDGEDGHESKKRIADAKVFGVFDGHGGPEVARFCQLYLVSVLTQQPTWKAMEDDPQSNPTPDKQAGEGEDPVTRPAMMQTIPRETPIGQALVSTFHALDRMIDDPERRCVFKVSSMSLVLRGRSHALLSSRG